MIVMQECTQCKGNLYGYSDGQIFVYLCWKCGSYFTPKDQKSLNDLIGYNPLMIVDMIANKKLQKVSN